MSAHFQWNGLAILETSALALEDANYHDECLQVNELLRFARRRQKQQHRQSPRTSSPS